MNRFHFFTVPSLMQPQSEALAYGPMYNQEETKYRVTSSFKITGQAKAFAVCNGTVMIQENESDSNYVNLVIMPTHSIETGYTPVQCFVYRGLKKENFIEFNKIISQASPNKTDLIESIWSAFNKEKEDDPVNFTDTDPDVKVLGWDFNSQPGNVLVPNIFNLARSNYALAQVKTGDFIGYFSTTESFSAGFEIILQEHSDIPTLEIIRKEENIIEITNFQPNIKKGSEPIAIMRQRERILNYIDPAAYIMICSANGNKVTYTDSGGVQHTLLDYVSVYNNNDGIVSKFYTKDVVYIDIRNENGYSLNYYKDYEGKLTDPTNGKHLLISLNDEGNELEEYYTDYWPIFTFKKSNVLSATLNVDLSVRTDYNPTPYIYYDLAMKSTDNGFSEIIGDEKFMDLLPFRVVNGIRLDGWTYSILFIVPVIASTATVWATKMYIGRTNYDIADLPNTSLKRQHYLDYIFGPISSISSSPPSAGTRWETVLGKKLLSVQYALGIKAAVEVILVETNTEIQFVVSIVDYIKRSKSFVPDTINTNTPLSPLGKLENSNDTYLKINNIELHQKYIQDKTKHVQTLPVYIKNTNFSYSDGFPEKVQLCCLAISRSEYNTHIENAISNIDENLHDVTLNIVGVSGIGTDTQSDLTQAIDSSGVKYYQGVLKIHGLDATGIHAINNTLQNIEILTLDGRIFQSIGVNTNVNTKNATDPNAYFDVDKGIEYMKIVEECYSSIWNFPNYDGNDLEKTCTRIRVHYYGMQSRSPLKGVAFQNLIYYAPYWFGLPIINPRSLSILLLLKVENGLKTYIHLTAQADENGFRDNPSPYLQIPLGIVQNPSNNVSLYNADFGQILYGFESLKLPLMGGGYYGYNNYELYTNENYKDNLPFTYSSANVFDPVKLISYDYSGVIANIATPVAEYFYHLKKGVPLDSDINFPKLADLDFYYNISAPDSDLYGNADAIGIFQAYKNLEHNDDLRLSDVFTLYYKGENALRTGIHLNSIKQFEDYTADKRWSILAKHLEVLDNNTWLPDIIQWGNSNIRAKLLNKMWLFVEFWYNRCVYEAGTFLRVIAPVITPYPSIYRFLTVNNQPDNNPLFGTDDFNPTNLIIPSKTEYQVLKESVEYCFETKFLTFLEAKCREEGSI